MRSADQTSIPDIRARLRAAVPEGCWLDDPATMAPYLAERRGLYQGAALAVARPADVQGVAAVISAARRLGLAIVPQGGNTGLCGGAVARDAAREIVLSLERMVRIRELDVAGYTLTAEAGCTVGDIKTAAAAAGRLFPLSFAAEGSAQLGGVVSTNAGGHNVLHYGMTRDLVLGLEVVLADGRIWNGLSRLHKDNTGYDLKQLFIGAEGTLGVITAATLKLFPAPRAIATALVACADLGACVAAYARLRESLAHPLVACELLSRQALEFAVRHAPACRDPFPVPYPWLLLLESCSTALDADLTAQLASALEALLEAGLVQDAVMAHSGAQAADFWRLREAVPEVQRYEGASIKNDISLPVAVLPDFVSATVHRLERAAPGVRPCIFGHLGDGNLHFNLSRPLEVQDAVWLARWDELGGLVNSAVVAHGGSISAEHGIGLLKQAALAQHKDPVALEMMRAVRGALDPAGTMNPGKLLPPV